MDANPITLQFYYPACTNYIPLPPSIVICVPFFLFYANIVISECTKCAKSSWSWSCQILQVGFKDVIWLPLKHKIRSFWGESEMYKVQCPSLADWLTDWLSVWRTDWPYYRVKIAVCRTSRLCSNLVPEQWWLRTSSKYTVVLHSKPWYSIDPSTINCLSTKSWPCTLAWAKHLCPGLNASIV